VAIAALERALSVLSETAAGRTTLAEGVALVETVERSAGVYMFAENYPYIPFAREMRRRYQAGDIGEVRYAEAEYLDEPADLAWARRRWCGLAAAVFGRHCWWCVTSGARADLQNLVRGRNIQQVHGPPQTLGDAGDWP
jgi:predicted dehydrogenase